MEIVQLGFAIHGITCTDKDNLLNTQFFQFLFNGLQHSEIALIQ